jgi:hypothetical protein
LLLNQKKLILIFVRRRYIFLFLDRFSDGDPSNNAGFNSATYDPNNLKKYTGEISGVD